MRKLIPNIIRFRSLALALLVVCIMVLFGLSGTSAIAGAIDQPLKVITAQQNTVQPLLIASSEKIYAFNPAVTDRNQVLVDSYKKTVACIGIVASRSSKAFTSAVTWGDHPIKQPIVIMVAENFLKPVTTKTAVCIAIASRSGQVQMKEKFKAVAWGDHPIKQPIVIMVASSTHWIMVRMPATSASTATIMASSKKFLLIAGRIRGSTNIDRNVLPANIGAMKFIA